MKAMSARGFPAGPTLGVALFLVALLLVYVGMGGGVRGTDQYWYLADAATLASEGAVESNNVFPAGLLSPSAELPPPFVHNILSVWLAALPTLLMGPVWGWLMLNFLSTAATTFLIWQTARVFVAPTAAILCALIYPLMPMTVWQTAQPLAEASVAFFAALTLFALVRADTRLSGWLLVVAALAGLYLSRQSYLPALLLVPPAFLLVRHRTGVRNALPPTLILVVAVAIAILLGRLFFSHHNVEMSYMRLLHTHNPGFSDNMFFNFDMSQANLENNLPFSFDILMNKLAYNLSNQVISFSDPAEALFYWSFNILVMITLWALWRCRYRPKKRLFLLAALVPVGLHLATIVLFQNQFRYLLPAFPGLLVGLAIAISELAPLRAFLERHARAAVIVLLLMGLLPSAAIARVLHLEMSQEGRMRGEVEALLDSHVAQDDRLMVSYDKGYLMLGYAARPRLVLFVRDDYGPAEMARLSARFMPDYLLAPEDAPVVETLAARPVEGAPAVMVFKERWRLYSLPAM